MICTNTDNYLNVQSTTKKEKNKRKNQGIKVTARLSFRRLRVVRRLRVH